MLEHSVLMNARLMREGVISDDRLVDGHWNSRHLRHQTRSRIDLFGRDTSIQIEIVLPGSERHHHLFQGGITSALADPVDRTLDLPGTIVNRGQGIGDGEP
jgi:hypothetical protein